MRGGGGPDSGRGAEGFGRAAPSERAERAKTFSPGRAASSTPFGPTGNSSVAEAAGSACFNTPRHEFRFQGTTHRHQARTAANHDRLIRSIPLSRPHPALAPKLRFPVSDFGFPRPCSTVGAAGLAEAGLEGWRAGGRRPETGDGRPEVERVALNTLAWRGGTADSIQRLGGKTLHLRSTPDRGQRPRLQRTRTRPIVARRSRAVLVAGLAEAGSEIRAPLSA